MVQSVNVPGIGTLNFPDGMSQADMSAAIQKNFPQVSSAPAQQQQDQGFFSKAGAAINNVGNAIFPSGSSGWDLVKNVVTAAPKAIAGGAEAIANGAYGLGTEAVGGTYGLARAAVSPLTGEQPLDAFNSGLNDVRGIAKKLPVAPETDTGKAMSQAMGLIAEPVQAAGDLAYNTANKYQATKPFAPLLGAATQGAATLGEMYAGSKVPDVVNYIGNKAKPVMAALENVPGAIVDKVKPSSVYVDQATGAPVSPDVAAANIPVVKSIDQNIQATQQAVSNVSNVPTAQDVLQRAQVLKNVGIDNARTSALNGDQLQAATEYQTGKFDEPAGQAAKDQFETERNALEQHIQDNIIGSKGTTGLNAINLNDKGKVLAAPYDAARQYFEQAKQNLYDLADQRAAGMPIKDTAATDTLLADPEFNNTAMARDKTGLVNAIKNQFDLYKTRNEGSLTVENAEQFRQWLNRQWSKDNSPLLSDVKDALDEDVFKSAGEDVYKASRDMHQLEKKTLDSNNGMTRLLDSDPNDPVNRATPYEKIPDALLNLRDDQFQHILKTYRDFPPELQPIAQQAIDTLKAHYGDRLIQASTTTRNGYPRPVWNNVEANNLLDKTGLKAQTLFDRLNESNALKNVRDAGDILAVNPNYPGAAAQLANASKKGLMTQAIGKSIATAGAGAGAAVAGVPGAAVGGFLGNLGGNKLATHLGESKALKNFNSGIVNLDDYLNTPKFPAPPTK
jgi:hypothetical protein